MTDIATVPGTDEVRAAADSLVAAFAESRLDDYFAAFAPDATFVFHTTAQRLASTAEYRELWQSWVDEEDFRVLSCASSQPLIQLFGDTAVFSHHVETTVATRSGGAETLRERETIVFTRHGGDRWLAVHEHLSPATEGIPQ
ncbi:YybH family protein [Streptomyces sp. NPDC059373]